MVSFSTVAVLDVELLDFQGIAKDKGVDLAWTTANEKTNAGFDIERSADGQKFEKIGFVKGNGTTKDKKNYSFIDKTPLSKTAYYRLQQVDFDGSKVSSNVISIEPKSSKGTLKVYPNPSSDNRISIEFPSIDRAEEIQISIVNVLGQVVLQQKTNTNTPLSIDLTNWAKGVYFVKWENELVKFIKQ